MYIFIIQNEGAKSKEEFQKDLSKWLQIPEKNISDYLKYNDLSLNTSEHYFSNFYNNFLKKYINLTLEELKLCLNNEINYKRDNLEVINSEDIMEKIYEKFKVNIFILKAIV